MTDLPHVTIAGGGIAGLTTALRLAERGYGITIHEQKSMLGGDLASRSVGNGAALDVYPHMYLSWYRNFWRLLADAGVDRATAFQPFSSVRQLRAGDFPRFTAITELYSPMHLVQNLFSGVGPVADLFVFGYATIDLLAERLNPTMPLDEVSVSGFLSARPYMTARAKEACDDFITTVWSIPGYRAAAEDYRAYLDLSVADHTPAFWLAKGSAERQVVAPLHARLEALGAEIHTSSQITRVSCTGGHVSEIAVQDVVFDPDAYAWVGVGDERAETVDELVLAVPPETLTALVSSGGAGTSIVDEEPLLAQVAVLTSEPIPIINLYFNRILSGIPAEPVGLAASSLALAFTDISQTWLGVPEFAGRTVLSVSASSPAALPRTDPHADAMAILRQLGEYLDFSPGSAWGESPDIDWEMTRYEPNTDNRLFVNEAGTDVWRPNAGCERIDNLALAGDFCANRIGMTTIESAVTTGLAAAQDVVARRGVGPPVEIAEHPRGSGPLYVWLRYAWGPYAYAAKAWSTGRDCVRALRRLVTPDPPPGL